MPVDEAPIRPERSDRIALTRRRPGLPLLSSHSARELTALLSRSGGSASQSQATSTKVLRHVYRGHPTETAWSFETLQSLGIGAWAHAALLGLDATCSLTIRERAPAEDGSERLLLATRDGNLVETVIIPSRDRTTLCVSSQVGCARACAFCETGRIGLTRQLDAGEIIDQVRLAKSVWAERVPGVSNIVFMGMGEPFDNLGEVAKATDLLTDHNAFALRKSAVTVSTVGVADKLEAFWSTCHAELAVSLNAPTDAQRARLMPINDRFPLAALFSELRRTLPKGRKVLFEYVLMRDVNDRDEDAVTLAELVRTIPSRVNVIPANPGPDASLMAPTTEAVDRFVAKLVSLGVTTLVRRPRGRDVGGACGQLAAARRAQAVSGRLPAETG